MIKPLHIKNFHIQRFRLFESILVKNLGCINLIAGKNNAGKSSFLEAIKLYASNISAPVLIELMESRQETWVIQQQSYLSNHPVRNLFFNYCLPSIDAPGIVLGETEETGESKQMQILLVSYLDKINDRGEITRTRLSSNDLRLNSTLQDVNVYLAVRQGKKTRSLFRLQKDFERYSKTSRTMFREKVGNFQYPWQEVPTARIDDRQLAALWDLIGLTRLSDEVIAALQLIEPRVRAIAFVEHLDRSPLSTTSMIGKKRIPVVKLAHLEDPLPLKSLGDGIMRLFHIWVTLVNAKDGILLIDEFENGLHWTIQPEVWNLLFCLSEQLNIQVFATTHSRDCIASFASTWQKNPVPEVDRSKAIIHTYLAWQKEPGRPMGQSITAKVLDPNLEIALSFITWIRTLFVSDSGAIEI
jgi:AAA15 family ATPase/GTPase